MGGQKIYEKIKFQQIAWPEMVSIASDTFDHSILSRLTFYKFYSLQVFYIITKKLWVWEEYDKWT